MSHIAPYILLDDQISHELRYYAAPIDIVQAQSVDEVADALKKLKDYHAKGYYLAGYLSYDLGFALETKLGPLMPEERNAPLLQFGVFETVSDHAPPGCLYTSTLPNIVLTPHWTEADYTKRFNRVMEYIRAGDVYQINLTFPMTGEYNGTAETLYAAFRHRQKGHYGGIISLGSGPEIISLSPELFFRKDNRNMAMRPMKGTRPRAEGQEADMALLAEMRNDDKSQAENLMIVDLLRNDLSRISETGSVDVPELFALETYPTLHQMTSRVTSRLKPGTEFADIFKSLFPCGSVTGAPKIRAMEIIDELEDTPRGAYCGAMGYIDPDGNSCFNVAIRTAILDNQTIRYNVGSGLVLDSTPADEYAECLLKADVLRPPSTVLIETFLWRANSGALRLQAHYDRLKNAAKELGYPFDGSDFHAALLPLKKTSCDQRIRLTLTAAGQFSVTSEDYTPLKTLTFALSKYPLTPEMQSFAHKISNRHFYDGERARIKAITGADEAVFVNSKDELCEGSFTSLFIEKNGQLLTPPLSAGLLPGVLRAELIESGKAIEEMLSVKDLTAADKIYLGNSLRGLIPAALISPKPC